MSKTVREILSQVVIELINQVPALSAPLIKLPLVRSTKMRTAFDTNGVRIRYNPNLMGHWSIKSIKFALIHEAMHFVQKCPLRIKQYLIESDTQKPIIWSSQIALMYNIAADMAINDILRKNRIPFPDKQDIQVYLPGYAPFEKFPRGKDTEWYFDMLRKEKEERDKQRQQEQDQQDEENNDETGQDDNQQKEEDGGDSDPGHEDEKGDDNENREEDEDGDDTEDDYTGDGEGDGEDGEGDGEDGEGDGEDGEGENDSDGGSDDEGEGEGEGRNGNRCGKSSSESMDEECDGNESSLPTNGSGITKEGESIFSASLDQVLDNLKSYPADVRPAPESLHEGAVNSTLSIGYGYGCGDHVNSFINMAISKELKPPTIPWQRQLRFFMTRKEHTKPTYSRPSRRRTSPTFIFPSRSNNTLGDAALVTDSSGSMAHLISPVAVEIHNLISVFPRSKFYLIVGDSAVRKVEEFGKGKPAINPAQWSFPGGGGTNMQPLFQEAVKHDVSMLICLTDLELPYFPEQPKMPVIWVVPIRNKRLADSVPYGAVILLDDSEYAKQYAAQRR